MATHYFKIQKFQMEYIPSDIQITITGYLADSTGLPYTESSNGNVATFVVSTLKSSLPPSGYGDFFRALTEGAINTKYTITTSGNSYVSSKVIDSVATTERLIPKMSVVGSGIPTGTTVESVRNPTSIKMTQNATADAKPVSLVFGTQGWIVDYSSIDYLVTVVNFGSL